MTAKPKPYQQWTRLNPPAGEDGLASGAIAALALADLADGALLFAAAESGLYRARIRPTQANVAEVAPEAASAAASEAAALEWRALPNAPQGVICLAASPAYAADHLLLAGTSAGISLSNDDGLTWRAATLPMSASTVLALAISPHFLVDGMLLAGTLEDGIFYSDDRGERWSGRSFGLLDLAVYSLAFSPDFGRDGLVFAGTETTLYYSYNAARAWRNLPFPEEIAPILSLAVAPGQAGAMSHERTVWAGTEQNGLYVSTDGGKSWSQETLAVESISGLAVIGDPGQAVPLAATERGVYGRAPARRGTPRWKRLHNLPNALCLATLRSARLALAASADGQIAAARDYP